MPSPIHPRGRRSGTLDSVPRALLFAAAMMMGCGFAMAAPAPQPKDLYPVIERVRKAFASPSPV